MSSFGNGSVWVVRGVRRERGLGGAKLWCWWAADAVSDPKCWGVGTEDEGRVGGSALDVRLRITRLGAPSSVAGIDAVAEEFFFFFFFFIVTSPRIRHPAWWGPPYGAASMYNEVT